MCSFQNQFLFKKKMKIYYKINEYKVGKYSRFLGYIF